MSNDTQQPPIGNVPAREARVIVGAVIRGANASDDPINYWSNILAMVAAGMAGHTSHGCVMTALERARDAQILHNDILSQPTH